MPHLALQVKLPALKGRVSKVSAIISRKCQYIWSMTSRPVRAEGRPLYVCPRYTGETCLSSSLPADSESWLGADLRLSFPLGLWQPLKENSE